MGFLENRVSRLQYEKEKAESLEARLLDLTTSTVEMKMKKLFEYQTRQKLEE